MLTPEETAAAEKAAAEEAAKAAENAGADEENEAAEYEKWLAKQPDKVRKLIEEKTAGLKSALEKERATSKDGQKAAKKLAEYEEAEKKRKEAEMTETERIKADLAEANRKLTEQTASLNTERVRNVLIAGIQKLELKYAEDVYKIVIESDTAPAIDADGKITGVDAALKTFAESHPEWPKVSAGGPGSLQKKKKPADEKKSAPRSNTRY